MRSLRTVVAGLTFAAVLMGGLLGWAVPSAYAVAMLRLSDGVTTTTISDNGAGDLNPLLGVVTFSGGIGDFVVNVSTGITKPVIGSPNSPITDLNSIDVFLDGGSPNVLTVSFTDVDFTGPLGFATGIIEIGGTFAAIGGSINYSAYLDNTNTAFGTGTLLAALGPFSPGAFSGTGGGNVSTVSPFSLTSVVTIAPTGTAAVASFDASIRIVPEPASLILIGSVLLAAGVLGRKMRKVV
jgi:hypothetical protein